MGARKWSDLFSHSSSLSFCGQWHYNSCTSSVFLSVSLSLSLSLSIFLSSFFCDQLRYISCFISFPSVCLSNWLPVYLSVCLFVCLFVCLYVWISLSFSFHLFLFFSLSLECLEVFLHFLKIVLNVCIDRSLSIQYTDSIRDASSSVDDKISATSPDNCALKELMSSWRFVSATVCAFQVWIQLHWQIRWSLPFSVPNNVSYWEDYTWYQLLQSSVTLTPLLFQAAIISPWAPLHGCRVHHWRSLQRPEFPGHFT